MFLITHCLFSSWNPHRLRNSDWAYLPQLEQDYLRRDCSFKAFLGQVCWARSYISVPQNKTPWNDMVKDSKINNHFFSCYVQVSAQRLELWFWLASIIFMTPKHLYLKNIWQRVIQWSYCLTEPVVDWIRTISIFRFHITVTIVSASWSWVLLTQFLSEFTDSDEIHIFDLYMYTWH